MRAICGRINVETMLLICIVISVNLTIYLFSNIDIQETAEVRTISCGLNVIFPQTHAGASENFAYLNLSFQDH